MVAIVTGNGVGLGKSSSEVLGQGGQLGLGQLPGAAGNAYVNASNGNLIIQRQDELLIGRGPDIGVYQTYNSQGTFDFDNNDNWQVSLYRQLSGLTGTINTAGSTITRTAADGTPLVYTYDSTAGSATLGKYVNKDGAGSYDTLTYTSGTNTWVWQDGNTRIKESYAVDPTDSTKWRITSVTDLDNNSLTYTYSTTSGLTTLIDKVTSANGEITQLIYNSSKQLTQINVINSSSVTTTRIRYTYESTATTARLTSVSTDLTPADGSIADGKTYTTTYTYDGTSKRIASITNSDGSKVSFTYETSGSFRLLTISDYVTNSSTINNTTTLNYTSATTTTVTNTNNAGTSLVTTLTYDTNKQLTNIQGPSGSGQNTSYTYNTNGDITQVTDNRGNWTKYTYDAQGNQLTQQDNLGNTIVRTYDSTATGFNQLLTQTVYTGVDGTPGDATIVGTGTAQTTRYTYDSNNHVRFTISAEGRVTEYRYNANGQLTSTHQYTDNLNTSTGNQTEAQMNTWLTAAVKSKSQRTDYLYDARGQLSETVVYTSVSSTAGNEGNGTADDPQMRTQYVYDQSGNLKQKIDARGVATTDIANDYLTSYSYDGLNRLTLTKQYDESGDESLAVSTQVTYTDASRQVKLTLANGLVTTSTYDLAGRLITVQKSDSVNTTVGSLGTTSYAYDKLNNLRMVTDPAGQNTYYLYDSANRKVGEIDPNKNLTEWVYNNNGQVIRTIQYNNAVTATLNATTALTNTLSTAGVRPASDATNDRTSYRIYDQAGRLSHEIDALGYVTESQYDGASRLLRTLEYNTVISAANLSLIQSSTTDVYGINGSIKGISGIATTNTLALTADATNDRANRNLYDNDGKLVGSLDAEGYLTEYVYDKAGRQLQKVRYATVTTSTNWATADLATLRGNATAVSADTSKHQTTNYIYNAAGQLTGVVDAENYLTTYLYDIAGNQTTTTRYVNKMVGALVVNTLPQLVSSAGSGNYVIESAQDKQVVKFFDGNNRSLMMLDLNGNFVTNYRYDNLGNLIETIGMNFSSTDFRGQGRQYNSQGNLVAEVTGSAALYLRQTIGDPTLAETILNIFATRYSYDTVGRLVSKIEPNGIDLNGIDPDSMNRVGNKTLYYYDNEGKLTYTINALGEVSQTVYNSFDQVAETRRYNTRISSTTLAGLTGGAESAVASAITGISAGGYSKILLVYDKRGQLISTTDELTNVSSRTYNAFGELNNRTDKIDGTTNVITGYQYDRKGLLKATTEDAVGINRITLAVYDAFGRVTQTADGRNNVTNYSYDRLGRTVTTTDALSQGITVTYDAFDRKISLLDARGNTTNWSYNAANRTMTMITPENVSVVTTSNVFGQVVKVTDGMGSNTTYTYDWNGQLTETVEDSGNDKLKITKSTKYDTAGRVYQSTDANGTVSQYSYDSANRVLSKIVDPTGLNLVTNYSYNAQGRQIWAQDANGAWTRMDYDAKGQLTKVVTDPANIPTTNTSGVVTGTTVNATGLNLTTSYTYNARGKKLTIIEGDGTTSARTTQYVYDKLGRLTSSVVDPGSGKLNLTTSYTYDKNDNLVLKTDAGGNKTVYTYDANNRLVYTVDALGYVTKIDYDANGNVLTTTNYSTALAAATLTTLQTTVVSSAQSNAAVTISPTSSTTTDRITRQVFDKDNRLSFKIDANNYVTKFEYDANGNVVKTTEYATALTAAPAAGVAPTVTLDAGKDRITQTVYDAVNRATYTVDANNYVTAYSYDVNGNVIKTVRYATAMVGTLTTNVAPQVLASAGSGNYVVTNAADQTTRYYYDALNRQTAVINAEGYLTKYTYDALQLIGTYRSSDKPINVSDYTWTNGGYVLGGREDVYAYDAAGRLTIRVTAIETSATQIINYTYDSVGNQIEIREAGVFNPATRTTQQKFDAGGRKIEVIDGEGKSTKTEYNAIGSIVKVTDALNNIGYFYNDALGRVKVQVDPEGAVTQTDYDAWGNVTQVLKFANKVQTSGTGVLNTTANIQFVSSAPANSVYVLINTAKDQKQTIEYNKLGQKLAVKTWTGLTSGTATTDYYIESFTYNAFGNALTAKARNGATTTYSYDKLGNKLSEILPVTARNAANTANIDVKNTFTYDAFSNLATKVEADGALTSRTTAYAYDKLNQQTQTTQSVQTTTGVSTSAVTQKTYDARGNLVGEKDANGNWIYHYYDRLDRRVGTVKADGSYTAWGYDALGNVVQEKRYSNKVQTIGTATLLSVTWVQPVGSAPTNGNSVYLVTDTANDRTTLYTYDKVGRQTGTEIQNITTGVYSTANSQYQVSTGSITTKNEYDALGNLIKQTDGNGNVTRTWYSKSGQVVAKLDAENYLTVWIRDVYGNISQENRYANKVQAIGTATYTDSGVPEILTTTPTGNRVYVLTDSSNDRITVINYDKLNRVSTETVNNVQAGSVNATTGVLTAAAPANTTTSYLYDGLNNIIQKTDATSAITNWEYDSLGRERSVINPQFSDYQDTAVRTRTDKEYDGLSNVTRELRRGMDNTSAATASGQVEMDDQITVYSYGVGGRLISETDAAGAVIQYEYDLNGNTTKQILKDRRNADQVIAGTAGVDDVTIYTYDSLNRQAKTTDLGTTIVKEVQYNSFNQITGKRTYTTNVTPTTWDEYSQYDQAGRLWKSNSGDGVTKVYVSDKSGNATASISGMLDMRNMTLTQVLNQTTLDIQNNVAQQTMYTVSVYDKKNQLVTTVQPNMAVGNRVAFVTNPLVAGSLALSYGTASWSYSWDRVGSSNHKDYYLLPSFTIPPTLGLSGNTKLEITATATNGQSVVTYETLVIQEGASSASSRFFIGRFVDAGVSVSLSLRLVQSTTQGDIVLGTQSYYGGLGGGGSISFPSRMYIANQPYVPGDAAKSTAQVLLSYRPAGTNQPYTTVSVPNMVNTAGTGIGGLYALDWTTIASGNYEFEYVAINSAGQILNQQSGSFNTLWAASGGGVSLNPAKNVSYNPPSTVTQTGNSLKKTGGASGVWTDASVFSKVGYTGSAYVSARAGQTNLYGMFGLNSDPMKDKSYTSLDYAWYPAADGNLYIFEDVTQVAINYGTYNPSDVLAIEYQGTSINYLKNGTVIRTVTTSAGRTFYMDSSLQSVGFTLNDVKFGNNASNAIDIVLNDDNSLVKTGGTNGVFDSDAFSKVGYTGSAYVSARAGQTNLYGMIALNSDPMTDKSYTSLDYAWYPAADGNAYIYENGTQIGIFGAYTPADVFAIEYQGTTINYLKNGTVMRTATTTAGRTFYMDSSFHNTGYTFNNVKFGTNASTATDVVLNNDNSFVKTGGANGVFDSDVYSTGGYTGSAYVSARAGQTNLYGMIALNSDPLTDRSYTSLDYAWYPAADGNAYIYESGTQIGIFGAYTPADVFAIEYQGTTVSYLKNGTVMRTVTTTAGRTLYMDSSFHNIGYTFNDVKFGSNASTASALLLAPIISAQTPLPIGDTGRAFFSNASISGMSSGLQLINQGVDAASIVTRYRLKNSSGSWIIPSTSFVANSSFGTGSFVLDPTGLSGMSNSNEYEVQFDIKDSSGAVLRTVTSTITKDASGNLSIGALVNPAASAITNIEIKRSQSYNAFGEIVSETDGRGNVTSYTYNTMGAMTKKAAPTVSVTAENGAVNANATPITEYIYDAIGRVIAVKDANGNVNTQVWLAGATGDGNITLEKHADGGIKKAGFDIFGNKRTEFDELATSFSNSAADAIHRTDYTYDKENRLTRIDRQARANGTRSYDEYGYDATGNRISHTTSTDVSNTTQSNATRQTEKTYYDSLGRVTKNTSFMGFDTTYAYSYVNNIVGIGGSAVSGWQKTTTDAVGRTLIDNTDMFNHVTWHQDLGGHKFTYVYNQAGWLTSQTSLGAGSQYSGQNIVYSYYNNGNIKAIHDKALGMYTYYEYDKDGNRTFEGYISLNDASNLASGAKSFHQYATITYDAMNRITSMADPKANISYEYDAVGNRRMVKSTYHDGANGSLQVQEYWYKYDSMNRFLITMGTLNGVRGTAGTTITRGTTGGAGVDITYNAAGQRTQAINALDNTTEVYSYTNDGYLTNVTINGVLRSSRTNDALGRVTTYQEFSSTTYTKNTTYDKDNRVTQETGNAGTSNYYYYTNNTDSPSAVNGAGQLARVENNNTTTVNTYYAYEYWDDAKQFAITNQGYNPTLKGNNAFWKPGYSELKYDVNGHLAGANDVGNDGTRGTADDRSFRYVNDAQGLILLRDEVAANSANKIQRYYYVDGKRVGDVGNDGPSRTDYVQAIANRGTSKADYKNFRPVSSADFDQNYEPISDHYPGFVATNYTVKSGDTLQSIARAVWGDADMWYLIADANGLTTGSTLTAGQVLTIPNKVTNIHNNSGTYRVYNPGEAIGDINPTLPTAPPPPKKKKGCGGFATLIVAVVAVVATVYLGPLVAGALGAPAGTATAMISAGVGSIAGQVAGNALGVQQGFDFKSFGVAIATAGIGSELMGASAANPSGALGKAIQSGFGSSYAAIAARAVVSNVIGQGIGNITGAQKGFNWSSVAISGIGAAAGASISDNFGLSNYKEGLGTIGTKLGDDLGRAAIDAGAFALTQLVVKGGKVNWMQVATDTITNLIQNRAESAQTNERVELERKQIEQEVKREKGNSYESGYGLPTVISDSGKLLIDNLIESYEIDGGEFITVANGKSQNSKKLDTWVEKGWITKDQYDALINSGLNGKGMLAQAQSYKYDNQRENWFESEAFIFGEKSIGYENVANLSPEDFKTFRFPSALYNNEVLSRDDMVTRVKFHVGFYRPDLDNIAPDLIAKNLNDLQPLISNASKLYPNVSADLITAVIAHESKGMVNAVSSSGALGVSQLVQDIWDGGSAKRKNPLGTTINPFDPEQAIPRQASYLSTLMKKYSGDLDKVLTAYNQGETKVNRLIRNYGKDWRSQISTAQGRDYYGKVTDILNGKFVIPGYFGN